MDNSDWIIIKMLFLFSCYFIIAGCIYCFAECYKRRRGQNDLGMGNQGAYDSLDLEQADLNSFHATRGSLLQNRPRGSTVRESIRSFNDIVVSGTTRNNTSILLTDFDIKKETL